MADDVIDPEESRRIENRLAVWRMIQLAHATGTGAKGSEVQKLLFEKIKAANEIGGHEGDYEPLYVMSQAFISAEAELLDKIDPHKQQGTDLKRVGEVEGQLEQLRQFERDHFNEVRDAQDLRFRGKEAVESHFRKLVESHAKNYMAKADAVSTLPAVYLNRDISQLKSGLVFNHTKDTLREVDNKVGEMARARGIPHEASRELVPKPKIIGKPKAAGRG